MGVLQDRLDKVIAESEAKWFRPKKHNGRKKSWRLLMEGTDGVEVCVWPTDKHYKVITTDPDNAYRESFELPDQAVRAAELLARRVPSS